MLWPPWARPRRASSRYPGLGHIARGAADVRPPARCPRPPLHPQASLVTQLAVSRAEAATYGQKQGAFASAAALSAAVTASAFPTAGVTLPLVFHGAPAEGFASREGPKGWSSQPEESADRAATAAAAGLPRARTPSLAAARHPTPRRRPRPAPPLPTRAPQW